VPDLRACTRRVSEIRPWHNPLVGDVPGESKVTLVCKTVVVCDAPGVVVVVLTVLVNRNAGAVSVTLKAPHFQGFGCR